MPETDKKYGFFDLRHPFYKPLSYRIAIVAACLGWAVVEFLVLKQPFWGLLFGAAGLYTGWGFFIAWDRITAYDNEKKGSE